MAGLRASWGSSKDVFLSQILCWRVSKVLAVYPMIVLKTKDGRRVPMCCRLSAYVGNMVFALKCPTTSPLSSKLLICNVIIVVVDLGSM